MLRKRICLPPALLISLLGAHWVKYILTLCYTLYFHTYVCPLALMSIVLNHASLKKINCGAVAYFRCHNLLHCAEDWDRLR